MTPLNFGFYAKYTIEEIILYPMLAILQNTNNLITDFDTVHSFDKPAMYYK